MATEELIVLLDARTAKLDAKLKKTNEKLDDLTEKTGKADAGLKKFGNGAKMAGAAILKTVAATAALSAAVTAMVLSSASGRRELELMAKQAKTSTSDFQALSFATNKYGINAEQIADISKDIADKVGEFSAAGTGAFQDYADVMKLSKDGAMAAAREFEGLSSQEILGKMVSRMEDASVAGDKMTFVLESMGNDASKLIPLFKGNSEELLTLKKRFNDVNDSLQITGTQAEALREVSNTFTLMTSSIGNATTAISATFAPVLDDFFNDIIDIVPDATQTIIDFVNSFLDAENIKSVTGVTKELAAVNKEIAMQKGIMNADLNPRATKAAERILKAEEERREELEAQLVLLQDQEKSLENANRLRGGQIGGEDGADLPESGLGTEEEIQEIRDRFKSEEILLSEKLHRDLEKVGDNHELQKQLAEKFAEDIQGIRDEARGKEQDAVNENISKKAKLEEKAGKAKIALEKNVANNAISLLRMIGGENKAAAIAALVIQKATALSANATATLSGAQLAYASQLMPGDPTSLIKAEAAKQYVLGLGAVNAGLIVATGLGEASNIASGGGGGGGGGSGGGGSIGPQQKREPDFVQESSSLEFTDTTDTGQTTFNLTVPDGDEIGEAIANWLSKAQSEGRV